ncbi:MAG: glycosyltransferase family 2 protein [Clostridia bacterium]|nr:glycosyltransferase family 2 protein [Clostridia bacterium]
MADLTAIILTKDESNNIEHCLKSVAGFVKRAVVVDSGSLDDTVEKAEKLGAEVYVHPFENYARQFNWAIDNTDIDTKWILRLDADERFTPKLNRRMEELLKAHENDEVNGFRMEADFFFLGKLIRFGGPKKRKVMIFRNGKGRLEDRRMDEHAVLDGGTVLEVKERFEHYDFKSMDAWISKMNWYATREMQDALDTSDKETVSDAKLQALRKKKVGFYYKFPMFLRCRLLFIYNYIFRLGFLDGKEGYIYHWMYQCWYRSLVDAKIFEQQKFPKPYEKTGALGATKPFKDK